MKFFIALFFTYFMLAGIANAGFMDKIFGPKSYEDCILKNMQGVTEKSAAREIRRACRKKFPVEKEPSPEIKDLGLFAPLSAEGKAHISTDYLGNKVIVVNLYNKSEKFTIKSIEVEIVDKDTDKKRIYKGYTSLSAIPPKSTGEITIKVFDVPPNWEWSISKLFGYE